MDGRDDAILVVDDDPADIELVQRALRRLAPYATVLRAQGGAEALDFFFGKRDGAREPTVHSLRAVLLDLHMPGIDGFEVLEKLKTDTTLKSIPVVVLTSSREAKDVERCCRLGANSYVVKPVEAEHYDEVLGHIVQYWLGTNEPLPAYSPIPLLHS